MGVVMGVGVGWALVEVVGGEGWVVEGGGEREREVEEVGVAGHVGLEDARDVR